MDRYGWVIPITILSVVWTLCSLVLTMQWAFVEMMMNPSIPNGPIYEIVKPAYQNVIASMIGMLGAMGGYIFGRAVERYAARKKEEEEEDSDAPTVGKE